MLIPIPYRVACDCEIQPVTRRFVSAPYTGPLERSVVRPGEVVSKDQVLAYMDGQQLRLKLAGVEAERQAARRKHSSSLAQGEVAQSQIARSEIRKLDSELASLNDQLSRLEIRSPCDGIVISGDLDKAQGATMEIGQTLFEVAPLDAMLAEVAIPESEIQYVSDSNTVSIKLNAYPYRTFRGEINTIHPSAEILDDESVFVAEVKLDDGESVIRPGMKGNAKVKTSWRPIGWNLFPQRVGIRTLLADLVGKAMNLPTQPGQKPGRPMAQFRFKTAAGTSIRNSHAARQKHSLLSKILSATNFFRLDFANSS